MFYSILLVLSVMKEIELKKRFEQIAPYLDEKARRLWCANEAVCFNPHPTRRLSATDIAVCSSLLNLP